MTKAPVPPHDEPSLNGSRVKLSIGIAMLVFCAFSLFLLPFPWGLGYTIIAIPVGAIIVKRNWRLTPAEQAHCNNCNQNITPQRHMSGGKKLAAAILSPVILMFGIYATMSVFVGGALYGGTGPSETYGTFTFFLMISIAIPIALYGTSPRSCPICKTPTR